MTLREISTAACWLTITASFVLSFSTWLALGQLAGFGVLAVALPFCVDGYVVTSLTTWLMPEVSAKLARFARANLYAVGLVGVTAQAGYHGWLVASGTPAGGQGQILLATAVGALPMAVATLAVHIRARVARELAAPQPTPVAQTATTTPFSGLASTPAPQPEKSAALPIPAPSLRTSETPRAQDAMAAAMANAVAGPGKAVTAHPAQVPAVVPTSRVAAPAPQRTARPRPIAEESGSGPRREVTVDDVRPLVRAGLGRNAIAERLGVGTGVARRLIDEANAEPGRLVAVP